VNDIAPNNEFRFKRGSAILEYIRRFSATERVIFGIFVVAAGVSALAMAQMINSYFMVEIPSHGGELREGVIGLPHNINPILAITDVDRDISSLIYSGLLKYDGDRLVPDLAESYKISDDGLTYDFTLKPGVTFQDGVSLTADDVAFTIQKIQDPTIRSPHRADWTDVTVSVVSPLEVKFILKQAYNPFLSNTTIGIIPKHVWNGMNGDQFALNDRNLEPIGSGPYKKASITRAGGVPSEYHLTTWKDYYATIPYLSNITFVFFADQEKVLAAMESGLISSLNSIQPEQAAKLTDAGTGDRKIITATLPRIFGVFFNQNQNPVLADKNVRQALEMTVDRQELVKTVLTGFGSAINGPLPANVSTSDANRSDLAGAQNILEKNGWKKNATSGIYEKKGAKNTVQTLAFDIDTADTPDLKQTAEIVRDSWTALGAKVGVKVFDSSDLYQNVIRTRKYDALLFGELIGRDNDVYAFWHSSQRNSPGLNVAMYTNGRADKLLENIRTTSDEKVRRQNYTDLSAIIGADIPAIFLYSPDFIYVIPQSLKGVNVEGLAVPSDRFDSVKNWYMNTEKVWKIFAN